jgi:DNA-binding winged helix-turn-helix (wHTH) protein/TolB-like protein/Tfp pilus assembly protein PilF
MEFGMGSCSFRFEGYQLDPRARRLYAPDGRPLPLTGKAVEVLIHLVEHSDRVVSKTELLDAVWADRVVEENNLNQAISGLRRALGTGAGDHRFILTVPGVGYRFIADVRSDSASTFAPGRSPEAGRHWRLPAFIGGAGAALTLLVLVLIVNRYDSPDLRADPPAIPTLAVLPFLEVPGEGSDELLALGLAETLITRLSSSKGLRVLTLGASQRVAATKLDSLALANSLGADYVIDGSTQRRVDRIRVNVRLLHRDSADVIWSETYDAEPSEVFALQDRIAGEIGAALDVSPQQMASTRTSPCDGENVEAYRAYLTGLRQIQAPSPASLRSAIGAFERAIALDPGCARAWAGLSFVWRALTINADMDPRETFPRAIATVEKALELDPDLAEAHSSMGFIHFWHTWNWAAAEDAFVHAIALNPNLAEARLGYAHLLSNLGRHDEALEQARLALELDPLWPLISTLTAAFLNAAGRYEEALAQVEVALELAPDFWVARVTRATIHLDTGQPGPAITDLERADQLSDGGTQALSLLGIAYAMSGREQDAEMILERMERGAEKGYMPATSMAAIHNVLGRKQIALSLLERALQERDLRLAFLKIDARWNNLRKDPQFIALASQLQLE